MKYFVASDSLYHITEQYPATLPVFIANGFTQLADPQKRETFGKALQLEIALMMRQLDLDAFIMLLEQAIEGKEHNMAANSHDKGGIRMKGLLPCPVRLPLQESLDAFIASKEAQGVMIHAELKAASMGLDWMKDEVAAASSADELDDMYMSAGFDMFFEEAYFGRFIRSGEFADPISWKGINPLFSDVNNSLKDPRGRYGIIAVVPAVFLVNTEVLGKRPVPQSWHDLLDPIYEKSVSLPVSDFDLFNAILLTIDKTYGREAVMALGRNMMQSMHPAQMVKSERQKDNKPAITIMPNFFTKMVKEGSVMKAVWPDDGAIISPIFMIGKKGRGKDLQDLVDLVSGRETASTLAHQGLFPSLHPDIDNRLKPDAKFLWLGWEYIDSNNLNQQFAACHEAFNGQYQTVKA
ncbi:MAG: ABC transporter substrate-binding protein [Bacteroidales bacterium]|nr:ABC transporter substrate-binding protein [Bacteroidales bacterium]